MKKCCGALRKGGASAPPQSAPQHFQQSGYPLDSGCSTGCGRFLSLDDPGVGDWFNVYRVLHQPEEQLASAARAAAVESKGELIQVVIEVFVADCPLMGSYKPPL